MQRPLRTPLAVAACAVASLWLAGCALTREQQLARRADRIEHRLVREQARAIDLPTQPAEAASTRSHRLAHLDTLRAWLATANLARVGVRSLPDDAPWRGQAYDVLDEAYGAIEWNIPLTQRDALKPLPAGLASLASPKTGDSTTGPLRVPMTLPTIVPADR